MLDQLWFARVVGLLSIGLAGLSMVANLLAVPVLLGRLDQMKSRVQIGMTDFKTISDQAWFEMMELRDELTKGGRYARESDKMIPHMDAVPFPHGYVPTQTQRPVEIRMAQMPAFSPPTLESSVDFGRGDNYLYPGRGDTNQVGGHSAAPLNLLEYNLKEAYFRTSRPEFKAQMPGFTPPYADNLLHKSVLNQCPPGPPGPPGLHANDGLPGQPGQNGVPGLDAFPDILDAKCVVCPAGAPGLPGPAGNRGKWGLKGAAGSLGGSGSDGWDGPPGLPGYEGQEGFKGKPGKTGKPGRPGAGGLGSPGPKGAKGVIGRTGEQGHSGLNIITAGPPGEPGNPGIMGPSGSPGSNGRFGTQGPKGLPGDTSAFCPCPRELNHQQVAEKLPDAGNLLSLKDLQPLPPIHVDGIPKPPSSRPETPGTKPPSTLPQKPSSKPPASTPQKPGINQYQLDLLLNPIYGSPPQVKPGDSEALNLPSQFASPPAILPSRMRPTASFINFASAPGIAPPGWMDGKPQTYSKPYYFGYNRLPTPFDNIKVEKRNRLDFDLELLNEK